MNFNITGRILIMLVASAGIFACAQEGSEQGTEQATEQATTDTAVHDAEVASGAMDDVMARGESVYLANCSACHQPNGQGLPGAFPPLAQSDYLLRDRREGTFALYRFTPPDPGPWAEGWALARRALGDDPVAARDRVALERVLAARAAKSRSFFDAVAPEWDALRKVWNDDALRARALARVLPRDLVVADVGTGTGTLALELAQAGMRVIAFE